MNQAHAQLSVIEEDGTTAIEAEPGKPFMASVDDATRVVEACLSHRVLRVLMYAENLTTQFFDLSSGEAGTILQKVRNYRVQLAVVCAPGTVKYSSRFGEMLAEERRGPHFRVFDTREAARGWLGARPRV